MNLNWKTFLQDQQAVVDDRKHVTFPNTGSVSEKSIYPLAHLGVLTVTGKDAAKLLQGQITCNVNDISATKSSLAAMCNVKGRAIATFLLIKKGDAFLLVLPVELLETVKKRLQMFVLRSDVRVTDSSDDLSLLGISDDAGQSVQVFFTEIKSGIVAVNFPALTNRKLLIADVDNAMQFWSEQVTSQNFRIAGSGEWLYLDIISGIPWVTAATSEEFIPQMLNLDKLGGISFNKGCYTGQEIVARTHYLGKAKREMFLAECKASILPEPNATIVIRDSDDQEGVGKVLLAHQAQQTCTMLVILQIVETAYSNLSLKGDKLTQIKLLPFSV
jgi:folate-binding protein YgfZ